MLLAYTLMILFVWQALIWAFDPDGFRRTSERTGPKDRLANHGGRSELRKG